MRRRALWCAAADDSIVCQGMGAADGGPDASNEPVDAFVVGAKPKRSDGDNDFVAGRRHEWRGGGDVWNVRQQAEPGNGAAFGHAGGLDDLLVFRAADPAEGPAPQKRGNGTLDGVEFSLEEILLQSADLRPVHS